MIVTTRQAFQDSVIRNIYSVNLTINTTATITITNDNKFGKIYHILYARHRLNFNCRSVNLRNCICLLITYLPISISIEVLNQICLEVGIFDGDVAGLLCVRSSKVVVQICDT